MNFKILITLIMVMLLALPYVAIAQDEAELPASIGIDIVNQHKVLFDYSAKISESVQISDNTYYVTEYKNILPFANGIIILDASGENVEDETIINGVIEAITWKRTLDELSADELTELSNALQKQVSLGQGSEALISITNNLLLEKSNLEAGTIDSNAATRINTQITQINTEITTLHASTEESLESLKKTSKKISTIYGNVDKKRNRLNKDIQSRQHALGSVVLGVVSILMMIIVSLLLIRKISSMSPEGKGAGYKKPILPALGSLFSKKKGIVGQLYSKDPQERARAAFMIGFITDINDDVVMNLISLLNDEDVRVRANVIQTLYKIGQKNPAYVEMAAPELRAAMSDKDEMVRKNAAEAYSLISDIKSQKVEVNAGVPDYIRPESVNIKPIAKIASSSEQYSISLRIMNKGRPLGNARIVLTDEAGRLYEMQTSNIGVATASVPAGEYSCLIEHGSRAMTQHIDVTENRPFIFQLENYVNVIISDEMTNMPLEGVTVEIRSEDSSIHKSTVTDSAGVASFDDFEADTILVSVQYIGYESVQSTSTNRDIPISLHAKARDKTQAATINDEMLHSIATLRSEASRYTDHLPHSCDLCIPQYLQNICLAALDIAQRTTTNHEQFIKASAILCDGIKQSMMEGRLADICIGKKTDEFDMKSCEVDVVSYLNKLDKISELSYSDVEKRLFDIDSLITKNMSFINIIPVVGVWKIAKKLIDAAHNEPQSDAFLFFADLVLDRVADMMKNPDIVKLLAQ